MGHAHLQLWVVYVMRICDFGLCMSAPKSLFLRGRRSLDCRRPPQTSAGISSLRTFSLGYFFNLERKEDRVQGRKRNPNPNVLVRIFSGGVGVFHVNGRGPKSWVRPSEPGKSNFFGGISRDFAGVSRGCPKSLRKKSLCSIFVPHFC